MGQAEDEAAIRRLDVGDGASKRLAMRASSFRLLRLAALCGVASLALYGGASCSSGDQHGVGGGDSALADVVYEGDANDEALGAMLAATAVDKNPPKFASFDTPSDGTELPSSPIPTFSWHEMKAGTDGGSRAPLPVPASRWASIDFLGLAAFASPGRDQCTGLRPLLDLLGPERTAGAHGASLNGAGYFLLFSTTENEKLLRVFTTKTSYVPDPVAWAKLKSAGTAISAWILMGVFDDDKVAADGGPFRGPWIGFTVKP